MQSTVTVTFRNIDPSAAVEADARQRAADLEKFHPRIVGCDIVIEAPEKRKVSGRDILVRLKISLPGPDVMVSRRVGVAKPDENVKLAIHEAFDAARRLLEDQVRQMAPDHVKQHPVLLHGRVDRLFEGEGYGFLVADDGEEIYFERDSLTADFWSKLRVDDRLRFRRHDGDKGPFATNVTLVD
jgi:cold shock CspA family protein